MRTTRSAALLLAGIAASLCTGSCGGGDDDGNAPPVNGGDNGGGMDATAQETGGGSGGDTGVVNDSSRPIDASVPDGPEDQPDVIEELVVTEGSFPCMTTYDGGSPTCDQCVHDQCCGMFETCQSTPQCSSAIQCLSSCVAGGGAYDTCYTTCAPSGPDVVAYVEFADCVQNQCSSQCGFPADGGAVTTDASSDGPQM